MLSLIDYTTPNPSLLEVSLKEPNKAVLLKPLISSVQKLKLHNGSCLLSILFAIKFYSCAVNIGVWHWVKKLIKLIYYPTFDGLRPPFFNDIFK